MIARVPPVMLESLDTIDWAATSHAYGEASDVPRLIRDLLSTTDGVRNAAAASLFSNIYHQGSVYPATVLALPFLIELLASDATPDRETVVLLVASILDGSGAKTQLYSRPLINPFTRKPIQPPPDLDAHVRAEALVVAEVRERGAPAVPWLLPYLRHSDAEFRSDIARALSHQAGMAAVVVPALQDALSVEPDPDARNVIASAVDELVRPARGVGE